MLKIGMIGPTFLLRRNAALFQQHFSQQVQLCATTQQTQQAQLDGLIITGWKRSDYLWQLQRFPTLRQQKEQLSLLGIAAGASTLGHGNFFAVMDCTIRLHPANQITTAILEAPAFSADRFTAYFLPDVQFQHLAPNLGVLCQDQKHGPVVVRQGNHLACSYVAELTPQPHLYYYWLEMVNALKNSRDF